MKQKNMKLINTGLQKQNTIRAIQLKTVALFLGLMLSLFNCHGQQIDLQGKDNQWRQVGTIPAHTPFTIEAHGMVSFGCWYGCTDGVDAAVDGNAFGHWCIGAYKTVDSAITWLWNNAGSIASAVETVSSAASALTIEPTGEPTGGWHWISYINANAKVNFDQGAFWVAITKDGQSPNANNVVCQPALYYWYLQLYKNNLNLQYHENVSVWVRIHDGGGDAFNSSAGDYTDNGGSYSISLNTDVPETEQVNALTTSGAVASTEIRKPIIPTHINLRAKNPHPVALVAGSSYELQNHDSKLFLDADNNASDGKVSKETGAKTQFWKMCPNPNGTLSLQNTASNKFLESDPVQQANGSLLLVSLQRSTAFNEWYEVRNYDGTCGFRNRATGRMLQGGTTDSGNKVFAGQKTGASSQNWSLKEK